MKFIPYGHQWIDEKDIKEVIKVLKSDWITTGPKIKEFEGEINKYIGCKYAVAVNSGTSALDIAVQALNLPEGSEVITTPFTFVATSNAILYNNLKPVFVDIERETRNINPEAIRRNITEKTRAIIYVDYAGHPCDIKEIKEIAGEYDLYLVEDACHAIGAEYEGKKIGNFADMTIFSFHPVKHITTGEGGALVTNDEEFHEKLTILRNHGIDKEAKERFGKDADYAYDVKNLGRNYRLTDFQSALGIAQLKKLDTFIERRQYLANLYNDLLKEVGSIEIPITKERVKHVWHIYTVLLGDNVNRDEFFKYMRNRGIGVNVHYIPIYNFTYYREHFSFNSKAFPVTEEVFSNVITLPLYPGLREENIKYIVKNVKKMFSR